VRWTIGKQILVPFLVLQVGFLTILAISTALISARQSERQVRNRLEDVLQELEESSYPLTETVLEQLHGLTGAHFVVVRDNLTIDVSTSAELRDELMSGSHRDLVESFDFNSSMFEKIPFEKESYLVGGVRRKFRVGEGYVFVLYPENNWAAIRNRMIYPPLVIGSLLILLTIVFSVSISKRFGRRISSLKDRVSQISQGSFELIEIDRRKDELAELADSINSMSSKLKSLTERIRKSERSTIVAQLTSGFAHQLKNLIAGVRMSIQVHRTRCKLQEEDALDVAFEQLRLTEEQIKGLLHLARGEGKIDALVESLDTILSEGKRLVGPVCKHRKIDFSLEGVPTGVFVRHADAVRSSLLNLMVNAIEAAGPRGKVDVLARCKTDETTIEVSDDGPGISTDVEKKVFEPFVTSKPEGIGLGLALVRSAMEECGGRISFSRTDDRTRFQLTIPSTTEKTSKREIPGTESLQHLTSPEAIRDRA